MLGAPEGSGALPAQFKHSSPARSAAPRTLGLPIAAV